ncbi:MAG: transglutaminase family protein [Bacteroidales bacterium]|nr:transglutaminase family protein [Bacteroidales bacterium]
MTELENHKEIDALVSLMDEPNEATFAEIQRMVMTFGKSAIPFLEEAWLHTFKNEHSKRLENTIEEIKFNHASALMLEWLQNNQRIPTDIMHILAEYIDDHYNRIDQQKWIDNLIRDCWLELNDNLTALEEIKVINHVLYTVYGLNNYLPGRNRVDGFFPDSFHHRKSGNAISMGFIYLMIGQKLNIALSGINLPNQFVLGYLERNARKKFLLGQPPKQQDVLFYVNPSHNGAIFTQKEITAYGVHLGMKMHDDYYLPCSLKTMTVRFLNELQQSLIEENRNIKGNNILKFVQLLEETPAQLGQMIS